MTRKEMVHVATCATSTQVPGPVGSIQEPHGGPGPQQAANNQIHARVASCVCRLHRSPAGKCDCVHGQVAHGGLGTGNGPGWQTGSVTAYKDQLGSSLKPPAAPGWPQPQPFA
jgi:hypothetical protein